MLYICGQSAEVMKVYALCASPRYAPLKRKQSVCILFYPPVIKKSVSAATQARLSQAHEYPISDKTKLPFICRLFAVYFYSKKQVFTLKHKT